MNLELFQFIWSKNNIKSKDATHAMTPNQVNEYLEQLKYVIVPNAASELYSMNGATKEAQVLLTQFAIKYTHECRFNVD